MHWLIYAGLMFASSNIYYLLVKKVQNLKVGSDLYIFMNCLVAGVIYLGILLASGHTPFTSLNLKLLCLIALYSCLISFVSGIIGYKAIEYSPNAGYSLVIQKSYAIYTSIVAIFLFSSTLVLYKYLAILFVMLSIGVITIEKRKKKTSRKDHYWWIILSIIAMLMFGITSISAKYFAREDVDPVIYLFWVMVFTSLTSFVYGYYSKGIEIFSFSRKQMLFLVAMGLAVTSFYFFKNQSDVHAPNIGYSNAINASSNAFFTILTAYVYGDHISWRRFLGVVGVIIGLIILVV